MKRIISLTESEFMNLTKRILESVNLNDYTDEDFIEVFIHFFRPWVKEKHGEEVSKYPLSFLIKKYLNEFAEDKGLDLSTYYYRSGPHKVSMAGRQIVEKGLHKLHSLKPEVLFTERYKKALDALIEHMNIPSYMKLNISEPTPYQVKVRLDIDFPLFLKQENRESVRGIMNDFTTYLKNFLGVEIGNSSYGQLDLDARDEPNYIGVDEWVKNVLNKELKKKIKEIPGANNVLHSIRFKVKSYYAAEIKLVYKDSSGWNSRREFKDKVRQLLTSLGYNTNILQVED